MPVDVAVWRRGTGVFQCFSRARKSLVTVDGVFSRASLITLRVHNTGVISLRLALWMSILLLCAGVESNPGPKYDDLVAKIDSLVNDMRTLHKETIDRLVALGKEVNNRLAVCESSVTALETSVTQLRTEMSANAVAISKVATDVARLSSNLSAAAGTAINLTGDVPASASKPASSVSIDDLAIELKRRDEKKLNIVVFGLPSQTLSGDDALFMDLVTNELGITPRITKTARLGKGSGGKPPPLLVSLRDEADKRALLSNARKLRSSLIPSVKDNVFINNDLTPLERQHFAALREELKLRKAAGEKDIVIRSGKIVLLPKK